MMNKKQIIKDYLKAESEQERKDIVQDAKSKYIRDAFALGESSFAIIKKLGNLVEGIDYSFDKANNRYFVYFN